MVPLEQSYVRQNVMVNPNPGILSERGWTFVVTFYNDMLAEAQLWINGNKLNLKGLQADFISHGSQFLSQLFFVAHS